MKDGSDLAGSVRRIDRLPIWTGLYDGALPWRALTHGEAAEAISKLTDLDQPSGEYTAFSWAGYESLSFTEADE